MSTEKLTIVNLRDRKLLAYKTILSKINPSLTILHIKQTPRPTSYRYVSLSEIMRKMVDELKELKVMATQIGSKKQVEQTNWSRHSRRQELRGSTGKVSWIPRRP